MTSTWTAARRKRLLELIRQFKENGIKMLLEHAESVRELLELLGYDKADRIDFERLEFLKTTFIQRDFRHVESDIVLVAPLLSKQGRRTRKKMLIYILIEHQSEPDWMMPLRLVDYSIQILKHQLREDETPRGK